VFLRTVRCFWMASMEQDTVDFDKATGATRNHLTVEQQLKGDFSKLRTTYNARPCLHVVLRDLYTYRAYFWTAAHCN
jgi:hypothetical protein